MAQITSVSYRRLRSFGTYENEAIEVSAYPEPGQTAEELLAELRAWVSIQLAGHDMDRAEFDAQKELWGDLRSDIKEMAASLDSLRSRRDRAVAVLKAHSIDTTELEGVPF